MALFPDSSPLVLPKIERDVTLNVLNEDYAQPLFIPLRRKILLLHYEVLCNFLCIPMHVMYYLLNQDQSIATCKNSPRLRPFVI